MFHGDQLRRALFQNLHELTGKSIYKAIACCRFPNKPRSGFKTLDWEIKEPKIRTTMHKLAMITFYVLVSARLSEKW